MKTKHINKLLLFLLTAIIVFAVVRVVQIQTDDAAPKTAARGSKTEEIKTEAGSSAAPQNDTLTLSFVGDCMFASEHGTTESGSFNRMAQQQEPDYFLRNFIPLFRADDFTIANCECVLSDNELQEQPSTGGRSFRFKGSARHAEIFRAADVQFASLANNHTHDYGQQGCDDTAAALETAGILPGRQDVVTYAAVKGQKLGIFCTRMRADTGTQKVSAAIREMQQADCSLIILYFHSGIEYQTMPEQWLVRAFRALIDEGADIIVSSHPHVLQPMEVYHGKPILYSLGNFCFGGNYHPPVDTVVYQAVYPLEDGQIGERRDVLIPCATFTGERNNYQPAVVTDESKKQEILNFLQTPVGS